MIDENRKHTMIVNDVINHHFKGKEEILAELIINEDEEFAENLLNELQMQLMFKQMNEENK